MEPIYFRLHSGINLMIIPDTIAHMNGHTVITRTYSIFKNVDAENPLAARSKESSLHLEDIDDPNYYGYIAFDVPDKLFTYTRGKKLSLNATEVEQIIEYLSEVRNNPAHWRTNGC